MAKYQRADIVRMLEEILSDSEGRLKKIFAFQRIIRETRDYVDIAEMEEVVDELVEELEWYEPDPVARMEDPIFYDDDRLEIVIREGLTKLKGAGE